MNVTVILCTYNRCERLKQALDSAANLRVADSIKWDVLVVDNNSRDQTREVVESFARRCPGRFRYLFEAQPGKSYALNAGIREASGDVVAFIDDDATVEPAWLQNLTDCLQSGEWAGVGGRILPEREFEFPPWLPFGNRHALAPLVIFDLGDKARELDEPPFGTNMAFHKWVFEKHGGFRTDLGPCPGSEIRGEDSEFGNRILAKGERLRYEPSAIVYHDVPRERIQQKYFLAWWYDKGRSDVREAKGNANMKWVVHGVPLVLFRRIGLWTLRWVFTIEPSRRFSYKLNVWSLAGAIVESCRLAGNGQDSTGS